MKGCETDEAALRDCCANDCSRWILIPGGQIRVPVCFGVKNRLGTDNRSVSIRGVFEFGRGSRSPDLTGKDVLPTRSFDGSMLTALNYVAGVDLV